LRRLLFAAAAVLVICAAVVAGDKLSKQAKEKIAEIKTQLNQRVSKEPLNFNELCWLEAMRLEKREGEEVDPLKSLYALRHGLHRGIAKLNPYWRPEEEQEKVFEYIHKEYDVSDIITQAPDRPAPQIAFGRGPSLTGATTRKEVAPAGGGISFNGDEGVGTGFDYERLQELIDRILAEDEGDEREIRYMAGKLICNITKSDAKKLESLLSQLREDASYSVNMEIKFIVTTADYLRKLGGGKGGGTIYLSAEAEKQLFDDVKQKKGAEMVASSEAIASDGQVVHIREGQQVSMLMDYDINTVGIPTLQPVVKLINEGLICQFRPVVIQGGRSVSVDVLASLSLIRKDVRKSDFMGGDLMLPAMDMSVLRTTVRVPGGTSVLVGGVASDSGKDAKENHNYVIFLKPTVEKKQK
jgi:hypothetical protein